MLVHYPKKLGKGDYKLGRILRVLKDVHGVVRTVVVGLRGKDRSAGTMPYVPKPLEEIALGIQRVAVIVPIEEQVDVWDSSGECDAAVESTQVDTLDDNGGHDAAV